MLKQQLRMYTVVISAAILVLFSAACGARKPPYYGVFLKQGGSFIEMEQGSGDPPETGVPETSERQPVVVLWVPNVDLGYLVMTEEVGGIGITYNKNVAQLVINEVTSGWPAQQAGIRPGDIVVKVDGVSVSTWDEAEIAGPVGTPVAVTVQRAGESQPRTFTMIRARIRTGSQVRYNLTPKGDDILELDPRGSLSPGMYCLAAGSAFLPAGLIPHWCFIVK